MAAGKELFKLFGLIGMQGVEKTKKQLTQIEKQTKRTQKAIDRFGRKVSDTGKVLTKVFTLPILAAAVASKKFVDSAVDLNETISKTGEIFGETSKDIEKWASKSAEKLGQSKAQAMDAAGTFAIFGKSAGLAGKDLNKFSTEMVELSSDMASFFNTEPEEAITAIGAAFRGETEPIRKYGVMLDDATMRQKALELGLVSTTKKALLPQTKVLAAQALILDQTKVAQGDFARTSAGAANQQRILAARLENVSASLGQLILPLWDSILKIMQKVVSIVERMIEGWKGLDETTRKTAKGFIIILAAIGPVVFTIGKLIAWSKILVPLLVAIKAGTFGWAAAMGALQKNMLVWVALIGTLVAIGWYWYSQWDKIISQWRALWENIVLFLKENINTIVQAYTNGLLNILGVVGKVAKVIPGLEEKVNKAKIAILKFQAAMFRGVAEQRRATTAAQEQTKATASVTETVKSLTDKVKKLTTATKIQTQADKEKSEAAKKAWGDELAAAEEREEKAKEFNAKILSERQQMTLTEAELLEVEKQKAIAEAEALGADVLSVKRLYKLKEQELNDKFREEEKRKQKQEIKDRLRQTSGMFNKLNRVIGMFSDNKLKRLDREEQRQIKAVEASEMSEEAKAKAIEDIEAKTEAKRQKIEKQRAIREKAAALFNIAINTASAVIEALPNIPLSIFVGALGVAEGIAVASAPLPFQEGGLITGSAEGVPAIVGERNTDELVFPLERGIGLLVDAFIEKISQIEAPSFGLGAALAAPGAGVATTINLNIGTFIGNRQGLKQLERQLETIRISENQRKGF